MTQPQFLVGNPSAAPSSCRRRPPEIILSWSDFVFWRNFLLMMVLLYFWTFYQHTMHRKTTNHKCTAWWFWTNWTYHVTSTQIKISPTLGCLCVVLQYTSQRWPLSWFWHYRYRFPVLDKIVHMHLFESGFSCYTFWLVFFFFEIHPHCLQLQLDDSHCWVIFHYVKTAFNLLPLFYY